MAEEEQHLILGQGLQRSGNVCQKYYLSFEIQSDCDTVVKRYKNPKGCNVETEKAKMPREAKIRHKI